jgi:aspartyl-tRNA(Asn)/glutamyl-tRNA(Gln) amidotransferase subunit A
MGYRFASASLTGATKNPWNESCWTCGSSSGSAAIVAGALGAFAIGTETWGSIICPSSFCGISGLRPTFGRVSRHGAMALSYSMDKIGPMARSAEDCALVLAAIAGHDPEDPHSLSADLATFNADLRTTKQLRIGWITNQWKQLDKDVETSATAAQGALKRAGADITEVKLPEGPWDTAAGIVVSAEGASAFEDLINTGRVAELNDPAGKIGGYISATISSADFVRAQRVRGVAQRKMDAIFENVDVLVTPSLPTSATPLDTNLEEALNFPDPIGALGNMCGLPAINVPCGFSGGKPLGLQFVGRELDDAAVIHAANLFQRSTDWHRRRPPVG